MCTVESLFFHLILYFDLYLLGDDSSISFIRTKHLFFLIYIRNKGEVGAAKHNKALEYFFTDRSKAVLLVWILFVICVSCLSYCLVCSLQPSGHLLGKG